MSHSKDFNETGKWQEATFFVWLSVAKQTGTFKVKLPSRIEIFQATWSPTGAGHNFAKTARDLINLLLFYSSKIIDTCCLQ